MSARSYLLRLGLTLLIFFAAIPGLVAGVAYVLQHTPGTQNQQLGLAYAFYFLGLPVWIIALAASLWWTVRKRVAAVGLPMVVSLSFIPLVPADWMWIMSFGQGPGWPAFLATVLVMLLALIFWPMARTSGGEESAAAGLARRAAILTVLVQAGLATISVVGTVARMFVLAMPTYYLEFYPHFYGRQWFFVVVAAQIWAIVAMRLRTVAPAS